MTEQIFRTMLVYTTNTPKDRNPNIKDTEFLLRSMSEGSMFGLQSVWRGQIKVLVSDPTRTILDLLVDPTLGGGLRNVTDILLNYLKSEYKDLELLIKYTMMLANGTVFKRLGFLLEQYAPDEEDIIKTCKAHITKGKVKLDPKIADNKLITRWRLWVPKNWAK